MDAWHLAGKRQKTQTPGLGRFLVLVVLMGVGHHDQGRHVRGTQRRLKTFRQALRTPGVCAP